MRDRIKNLPVNWVDGMKINKNHFITQDDAWRDSLNDIASLTTSHLKYGILSPSSAGEENFNVKISPDNQNTIRVTVLACQALTSGGIRINLPATNNTENISTDAEGNPSASFQIPETKSESQWWVIIIVHPFQKKPVGNPDLSENPPRFPNVLPTYSVKIINENEYNQFAYNPYALIIGKVLSNSNSISNDNNYIPPCYSTVALSALRNFHAGLDDFLAALEVYCSQIVQKIYIKKQQNEISELVLFLCDRLVIFLSENITKIRWIALYESPVFLFTIVAGLARMMKNVIDLRIGSGKEEMMNYLSMWCELKPGELESMLIDMTNMKYNNNDINPNIHKVNQFKKVIYTLFETLSKLEFIGQIKKSWSPVVSEQKQELGESQQNKPRGRFSV